jgi:hypothetical protein
MHNQNCLDQAMFAASESYSHTSYAFDDCACAESGEDTETAILDAKDSVISLRAA